MKLAISNIALSPYDHEAELEKLPRLDFSGLEVAPSRVWRDTWHGLKASAVEKYRRQVEKAGLHVVGLHSLFYDHPDLGLFKESEQRAESLDFLVHLSCMCRDLGGRTMIYGGGRRRGCLNKKAAWSETLGFIADLIPRIEGHGTVLCFEPLGPKDTDFLNSAHETLSMTQEINHPALRVQLDAKALLENDEAGDDIFHSVVAELIHYHANEPGLGQLGTSGKIDHHRFAANLRAIGYEGYVSLEQRCLNESDPLSPVSMSARVLNDAYA